MQTLTNEEVRQLLAQGYEPVGRRGEVYYCRREQIAGSLIAAMSCKTADQMKLLTQESKDMLAAKQKPSGCGYGGC
jgi:curli biogenesis system outer membrane secretion channel CsgG